MNYTEYSSFPARRLRTGKVRAVVASGLVAAALAGVTGTLPAHAETRIDTNTTRTEAVPAPPMGVVPSIRVPAEVEEVSTGKHFTQGSPVNLSAVGRASYGMDTVYSMTGQFITRPDGLRSMDGDQLFDYKFDENATLPSAPVGALVGRIGNSAWFNVGWAFEGRAPATGELVLSYNDVDTLRADNKGEHEVYSDTNYNNLRVHANRDGNTAEALQLKRGDTISINASGESNYSGGPDAIYIMPDGRPHSADKPKYDPSAVLPSAPLGALIGRVGTGPYFLIGQSVETTVTLDGQLNLQINDIPEGYGDNHGGFDAKIITHRAFMN